MAAVGTLTQLIRECSDPVALAAFWREILDLDEPEIDGDWVTLRWEQVGRLSFHRVEGYAPPPWPDDRGGQHLHLDLLVDDLATSTERVLAAGARALTDVINPGPKGWRVFADPSGHPFCLVSVPE
ncbi:MAG: VOC family protein [Micrococcales bacterium]|nr:VOC family protein [Micrococcales bacterium]